MASSGGPRVAVIGAGVAGLAAAYFLGRAGARAEVFEAEAECGGLAGSFDLDGLRVERYYHFICRPDHDLVELASELGLGPLIKWRTTRTTFFYEGKLYPFTSALDLLSFAPIPFWSRINMGIESLRWSNLREWERLDEVPAREWLISRLGQRTYDVVWAPLLTMKFGEYHDRVSAAWIWHRVQRVARSRRSPVHPQKMGYFEGGTEVFLARLRERIEGFGGRVRLSAPVEAVLSGSGRARGVRAEGAELEYDAVISTAPLPRLAALLPPELREQKERLARVNYLGVACVVARLDRSLSDSFWCNIHDHRVPFNGVIETSKLNPELGRSGPLVYSPNYLPADHPRFAYRDDQFFEEFAAALPLLRPGLDAGAVRDFRVFRSRYAQAVCPTGFRHLVPAHRTDLAGLFMTDSTQLYPEDRTVSGTIAQAREASRLALEFVGGGMIRPGMEAG